MINLALIGTGSRGVGLARTVQGLRDEDRTEAEIMALADINPVRLKRAGKDLDVGEEFLFEDYEKLLQVEEIDAVIVATPDRAHFGPALAGLRVGKHVYCEKVMATTIKDCTELAQAVDGADSVFYVGHNVRFTRSARKLNELIKSGELGQVRMVWARRFVEGAKYWHRWHRYKKNSGGLLAHKGAHYLDQLNWNSGSRPSKVVAFGSLDLYRGREDAPRRCRECPDKGDCPYDWDIEGGRSEKYYLRAEKEDGYIWDTCIYQPGSDVFDNASVMVSYENGVKGTYMECHFAPFHDRESEIGAVGDEGLALARPAGQEVLLRKRKSWSKENREEIHFDLADGESGGHGGADFFILDDFLSCVGEGREPESDVEAGWDSAAVGLLAQRSAENEGVAYEIDAHDHRVMI